MIIIITEISNETTNKLTIYAKLCREVTIFYRQKLASPYQALAKVRAGENLQNSFSSNSFIAGDSFIKIISSYTVVFNENPILHF